MPGITTANQNTQTTQQSSTSPGALGLPTLNGILGQLNPLVSSSGLNPAESGAISQLTQNASTPNTYAPAESANATSLLAGGGAQAQAPAVQSGLSTLQSQLTPFANGSMVGNNPALQAQLAQIASDTTNQVNGQFAAAGRDMSGMNSQALGRGIAQGEAPVIANQYNQDVANQLSAANTLYGANNTTQGALAGMQTQANANQQTGVNAATTAQQAVNQPATATLAAQELGQQIPAQNLGLLAQIGIPIAGMSTNSTGSGTSNTQSTPSTLSSIAQALGMFATPASAAGGGTSGAAGLLALLSDRRAKADIVRVGTLFDGTPVYRYRYIGQNAFQIGLMADEVEKHTPEAVIEINGYKAVEYKAATEKALSALNWV